MQTRSRTRKESRLLLRTEVASKSREESDVELDDTISLPDEEERRPDNAESIENRVSEELVASAIRNALEKQRNEFEFKLDEHQLQASRDLANLQNEMQ